MIPSLYLLSLLGLAAAAPLDTYYPPPPNTPKYPTKSTSKGFRLVVHVTDKSQDFHPSIQFQEVLGLHTGAGLAIPGPYEAERGVTWYQNGTLAQLKSFQAAIITDAGTPSVPEGFQLHKDSKHPPLSTATMNFGVGQRGVQLTQPSNPLSYLLPGNYLACNSSLLYYSGDYFITINQTTADTSIRKNVPKSCAPIRLIPECDKLQPLDPDAYASHEFAQQSKCYKDVSSIKWSDFD